MAPKPSRIKKDGTPYKKMGRPVFGKDVMSKTKLALDYLREHPEASIRDAAQLYDVSHTAIIKRIRKTQQLDDHIAHCPVCQQPMRSKRAIANVNVFIKSQKKE